MSEPVRLEIDDRVAIVSLDSPPLNIFNLAMRDGLIEAFGAIHQIDGLGAMIFMAALTENYSPKLLPSMRPIPLVMQIVLWMILPFAYFVLAYRQLSPPSDENPIHQSTMKMSGVKRGCFSQDYSLEELKRFAKSKGVSVNDALTAVLSTSLKEYFVRKGDEKTQELKLMMPMAVRSVP